MTETDTPKSRTSAGFCQNPKRVVVWSEERIRGTMSRRGMLSVAALAGATLLLESTLTRLLAVAQFYHFAFLAVSLALLGFGASGTLLSVAPRLRQVPLDLLLAWSGFAFCLSTGLAYGVINFLPFDSYSIAWERRQIPLFVVYYLALTLPFLCGGLGIGAALAAGSGRGHRIYAANLLGSAGGALLAPAAGWLAGVPGAVLISAMVGFLPVLWLRPTRFRAFRPALFGLALAAAAGFAVLTAANLGERAGLGMTISPYKSLAQARRFPGSSALFGRWDAVARVDVIADAGTRMLPGLSYAYGGLPPPQLGLARDADSLLPITLAQPEAFEASAYLPEALAFELRPGARVLILEPGGGLGVLQALAGGAREVTAAIGSPLERRAVAVTAPDADPYADGRVRTMLEPGRSLLGSDRSTYDVVFLPLTDSYRPVTSGAYSLAETYGLTVEAFEAALARLAPDGLLVVTRWLQTPPSESLRLIATLIEAAERRGVPNPGDALVAFRGIQTITVVVCPGGWRAGELAQARQFLGARRYDLVWAPDVQPEEVNRFNRLPVPADYEAVRAMLAAADRGTYYAAYPFAIAPATDDAPFFFHFFRWSQTRDVLASLGKTWQPFGGSGYLVLFALLALVLVLSAALIVLPLIANSGCRPGRSVLSGGPQSFAARSRRMRFTMPSRILRLRSKGRCSAQDASGATQDASGVARDASALGFSWRMLVYFGGLGLAFLFVEVPLIQRYILLFGHPIYAFTVVVITLLLFGSLGALAARSPRLKTGWVFAALVLAIVVTAFTGPSLIAAAASWSPAGQTLAAAAALAPLAILMGMPFPLGLARIEATGSRAVAWAWAINGCASVIAAVLAAIFALSWGFTTVLLLGAAAYALAGLISVSF